MLLFSFRPISKLVIVSHYKFEFLHQNLNINKTLEVEFYGGILSIFFIGSESWQSNFSKKNSLHQVFVDIQTYPHLSRLTEALFFVSGSQSNNFELKKYFHRKDSRCCSWHWTTDIPIFHTLPVLMFCLVFETLRSLPLQAWHLPSWSLSKLWNLWRSVGKSNHWFFLLIRILIVRNIQIMLLLLFYLAIQSSHGPQLQPSFLPPKSQWKDFQFWGDLLVITVLSVPYDWHLVLQNDQEVFSNKESSRFSNTGFPWLITWCLLSKCHFIASFLSRDFQ